MIRLSWAIQRLEAVQAELRRAWVNQDQTMRAQKLVQQVIAELQGEQAKEYRAKG